MFHVPVWTFAVVRFHLYRRLVERKLGHQVVDIRETLCPGDVFPFVLVFLFRATEGMSIGLLPAFFQGSTDTEYFAVDVTKNWWVALTILLMFLANAVGSSLLGKLMQWKKFEFYYKFCCLGFSILLPLHMLPHARVSFIALRTVTSLLFPGPVVLTRIALKSTGKLPGSLRYVPLTVVSVVELGLLFRRFPHG